MPIKVQDHAAGREARDMTPQARGCREESLPARADGYEKRLGWTGFAALRPRAHF